MTAHDADEADLTARVRSVRLTLAEVQRQLSEWKEPRCSTLASALCHSAEFCELFAGGRRCALPAFSSCCGNCA